MKNNSRLIKVIASVIVFATCASFVASANGFSPEPEVPTEISTEATTETTTEWPTEPSTEWPTEPTTEWPTEEPVEPEEETVLVGNEFLEYCLRFNGTYTVGTTGGNPGTNTDNNKKLLYGHSYPGTSYATLVVDNKVHTPSDDGIFLPVTNQSYDSARKSYTIEYSDGTVKVEQIFTLVNNNSTGRKDVVELKYVVTNLDDRDHDIGFRIMLDTMLADNDSAPFRVPGTGDVTTEKEYAGSSVPQFWQVFDYLENPSVIAQGTFIRAGYRIPDKVQFANWRRVYDNPWGYEIMPGASNGDSAVTATWNKEAVEAGESETYVTYYGLSELQQVNKELSLSVYSDATIDVVDGDYVPNPTVATAYVKNISDYTVDDVVINIDVTSPLSVGSAAHNRIAIGSLAPGEEKQVSWDLDIAEVTSDTTATITVSLSGTDVETLEVSRNISIPSLEETEKPTCPEKPTEPEPTPVRKNIFQRIWGFIVRIFVFLGLS